MAVDVLWEWTPSWVSWRNFVSKDETVEPPSRDKLVGANGDREKIVFPGQLTTSGTGNPTRLIHTLARQE